MKFINNEKVKVRLLCDNQELACAEYCLKEFQSDYVSKIGMNSMLCGINNQSCYLKFYIGMIGTESQVDVREINIRNYKQYIYLGQENYYACEVLPEDWIDILPSRKWPMSIANQESLSSPQNFYMRDKSSTYSHRSSPDKATALYQKYNKRAADLENSNKRDFSQ